MTTRRDTLTGCTGMHWQPGCTPGCIDNHRDALTTMHWQPPGCIWQPPGCIDNHRECIDNHRDALTTTGMHRCIDNHRDALTTTGMHWQPPGCIDNHRDALTTTGMHCTTTGMHWQPPGCIVNNQDVIGYIDNTKTGMYSQVTATGMHRHHTIAGCAYKYLNTVAKKQEGDLFEQIILSSTVILRRTQLTTGTIHVVYHARAEVLGIGQIILLKY